MSPACCRILAILRVTYKWALMPATHCCGCCYGAQYWCVFFSVALFLLSILVWKCTCRGFWLASSAHAYLIAVCQHSKGQPALPALPCLQLRISVVVVSKCACL